jgi:putative ABC transport system substrate-binding protein
VAGGPIRSLAGADGRSGSPPSDRDRYPRQRAGDERGQSGNCDDPNRVRCRGRSGPAWPCGQPCPSGGNATGVNFLSEEVAAKRLRLLHELVPTAARVAVLVNPANAAATENTLRDLQEAAPIIGLQLRVLKATTIGEIDAAFATLARERPDALFVGPDGFFSSRRVQLAILAARQRIPASYTQRGYVAAGGLMSYGTDQLEMSRQVGVYAGSILKGAKPIDLPVLQSTRFEFVINLQTARALGIEVPPGVLSIADEVIE